MPDIVSQAENLGKHAPAPQPRGKPRQGQRKDAELSIFSIHHSPFSILHSPFSILHSPPEKVWALKDVRLEIRRGEFEPNYGIIETRTGVEIFEDIVLDADSR